MPGSPARNDLTTLFKTTFSAPRISFVDLQLLPIFKFSTRQGSMAGLPVHGIPMDTKRRARMVTHGTLLLQQAQRERICVGDGVKPQGIQSNWEDKFFMRAGFPPKVRSVDVRGEIAPVGTQLGKCRLC